MVRAWFLDTASDAERRLPHMTDPARMVELGYLAEKCGVKYWQIDVDNEESIKKIREDGNYDYEDELILQKGMPDYDTKMNMFWTEHLHIDDEIRFVVDGSGYFDIRNPVGDNEEWIRIEVVRGDMVSFPAGIYHRFTLDSKELFVVKRYFSGTPVWKAFNRPQDEHPSRQSYVDKYCRK